LLVLGKEVKKLRKGNYKLFNQVIRGCVSLVVGWLCGGEKERFRFSIFCFVLFVWFFVFNF
jgi:hypothetical protein